MLREIHLMRKDLRHVLRTPRRWEGVLRRSALARAIQGSNSIEGYQVAEDDAAAALDGEEPISAEEKTSLRGRGRYYTAGEPLRQIQERRRAPPSASRSVPVDEGKAQRAYDFETIIVVPLGGRSAPTLSR